MQMQCNATQCKHGRSACYTSASGECCPVTLLEENMKTSFLINSQRSRVRDRTSCSHDRVPDCSIQQKRINQLQTFACFRLRINLCPTQIRGNSFELSFVFLGLWLPKFTQIPASVKRHLLGVLDTTRQCWDVLVNPAEHLGAVWSMFCGYLLAVVGQPVLVFVSAGV